MNDNNENKVTNLPSEAEPKTRSDIAPRPRIPEPGTRIDPEEIYGLYQHTPSIFGITMRDVLEVVKRRYLYLLLGLIAGVELAVLATSFITPLYAVSSQVVITRQDPGQISDTDSGSSAFIATQAEVLQSPRVVEAAVSTLPRPSFLQPGENAVASALDSVNASAITGTRVIALGYLGADPNYGAALLTAIVDNYLSEVRESTRSDQENLLEVTGTELEGLRNEIVQQEKLIEELRRSSGMVGSADDAAAAQLANVESYVRSLRDTRNRRIELQSRLAAGGTLLIGDDPARQALQEELRIAESELAKARSTLTAQHPSVVAAERNAAALRSQLANSTGGSRNALQQQINEVARQEAELAALEKSSRLRLEQIELQRQEENKLLAELARMRAQEDEWRRELLDQRIVARLARTGDVGIGARLIETPVIPNLPVWPNKKFLLLAGGVLGLSVGFFLGLYSLYKLRKKNLEEC